MKRLKLELTFLLLLSGLLWFLSKEIPIHKVEYIELDWNPGYKWTAIGIFIGFAIFNHFALKFNIYLNVIYSVLAGFLSFWCAKFINYSLIGLFVKLDNQKTQLGWEFKYKWMDLFFFAILLILMTEFISTKLHKEKTKT